MNLKGRPPSDDPLVHALRVRLNEPTWRTLGKLAKATGQWQSYVAREALKIGLRVLAKRLAAGGNRSSIFTRKDGAR